MNILKTMMKQSSLANTTKREFLGGLEGNSVKAVGEISLRSSVLETIVEYGD